MATLDGGARHVGALVLGINQGAAGHQRAM
jgi:hypothetical protein